MTFMVEIDDFLETPIYAQIRLSIISGIRSGELRRGDILMPSRELAKSLGINYHTVNKAYDILIREGFLFRDKKKRTIVSGWNPREEKKYLRQWEDLERNLIDEAMARGIPSSTIMDIVRHVIDSVKN